VMATPARGRATRPRVSPTWSARKGDLLSSIDGDGPPVRPLLSLRAPEDAGSVHREACNRGNRIPGLYLTERLILYHDG
jgi:hypothetical protein